MNRVAYTILLNGLHHLKHNNYYNTMINNFDLWVIVEGVSQPGGSTSWCREINSMFHKNYLSIDGTSEFLDSNPHQNVVIIRPNNKPWLSKDEQVNAAIHYIKDKYNECLLWQIDIDEQWTLDNLQGAEEMLLSNNGKTGCFTCNYFVGPHQQVYGEWGECVNNPYRRLWNWSGEFFKTHEPPQLNGKNGPGLFLPQRFNHFSYYFAEDVKFKENYYGGYTGLVDRWEKVQQNRDTIHVRELLGPNIQWSYTHSIIKYTV